MPAKNLSRRDFLRLAALGSGSALVQACARRATPATPTPAPSPTPPPPTQTPVPLPTSTPTLPRLPEIEITTSGWPVDVYSPEEIAADPTSRAIHEAIQVWLERHPGVRLTKVPVNIWDPTTIPGKVAAGEDCTFLFGPTVGGGWGLPEAVRAFQQGRLADVTPLVEKYRLSERVLPALWSNWGAWSQTGGQYFCYPLNVFTPATQVFVYRKDRLDALGIGEPRMDWTWEKCARIFKAVTEPSQKQVGLVAGPDFLRRYLAYHGADLLTEIPQPDQPWHWTIDWSDPRWGELAGRFRQMVHRDKSIQINLEAEGDVGMLDTFRAGTAAFALADYAAMFTGLGQPDSLIFFAETQIKSYVEVIGMAPIPFGDGYRPGGEKMWGPLSFSPNQTPEQLALAVDLIDWLFFGDGLDIVKASLWNALKDPRAVFSSFLYLTGRDRFAGVPAGPEDAWGQENVDRWRAIAGLPVEPRREDFFPPEQNPGPSNAAVEDKYRLMLTDPKFMNPDIQLLLGEAAWKEAAKTAVSSIPADEFRSSARQYYAALDGYLRNNLPEFYSNRYLPFFQGKISL